MRKALIMVVSLLVLTGLAWPAAAPAEEMITDTTSHNIDVGVRFSGELIHFFGTVPDPEAEVVVKLYSRETPMFKLMRKGKVVLFWMGVKQFEIHDVPHIFKIHSSKPIKDILTPEAIVQHGLSYDALKGHMELKLVKGDASPDDLDIMFDGLIGLKEKENLFRIDENRIRITQGRLFEHYFTFPDKAKEGEYVVESFAVKNGQVVGQSTDVIKVTKVGLTAWLYRMAMHHGVFYGIMAVVIALAAGLLVGSVFKGGGH